MPRKGLRFPNGIPRAEAEPRDLRDRIAASLAECHAAGGTTFTALADAVIAKLGLDTEHGCPTAGHHGCRCARRYVTDWLADE